MKKLIGIFLALVLVFSFSSVTLADSPEKELRKGDKVVLGVGTTTEFLGRQEDGKYLWKATIGAPQYLEDLVTPINTQWHFDTVEKQYYSGANLFDSTVKGGKVTVDYKGASMSWEPDVFVDGKKQSAASTVASIMNPDTSSYDDPVNSNYIGNTLYWEYGNITRSLRIIEGMLIEYYTIDSMPDGDIRIASKEVKDIGFNYTRPQTAFDADYNIVPLTIDGKEIVLSLADMAGAVFPITIDPDSSFTTSASDGYLYLLSSSYVTARTFWNAGGVSAVGVGMSVGQETVFEDYRVKRSFVYFSTAGLPDDCTVTVGTLKLYVYVDNSATDFLLTVQSGMPTYPSDPLVKADYLYTYYTGDGGSLTTNGISTAAYSDITLSATGRGWVNRTGATKFAVRSSRDIAGTTPTGREDVLIYTYEKGTGYWPTLDVTYTLAAAPTVTTVAASNIATTTARLNSTLVDDGGGVCDVRFGYGTTTQATIDAYDSQTAWEGAYSTGEHPFADIDTLVNNTLYYFRVAMRNATGTTLGSELTFTTINAIADPTDLRGYPQATSISLGWTKGAGSTQSMVRHKAGSYPTTVADGMLVYLGTSSTTTHSGLTPGTTYYYSVWGESGGSYSTSYDSCMVTTSAYTVGGDDLTGPDLPGTWMQSPDATALSGLGPIYRVINTVVDSYEVPRATAWLLIALLFCIVGAVVIYLVSSSLMVASLALGVLMAIGAAIGLVPFWMLFFVILFILVTMVIGRRALA